jgi:hypothetical protein
MCKNFVSAVIVFAILVALIALTMLSAADIPLLVSRDYNTLDQMSDADLTPAARPAPRRVQYRAHTSSVLPGDP